MKLVDDANLLWKKWSTRIAAIQLASVITWWAGLPPEWKAAVPNWVLLTLVGIFGAGFIGAQLISQPNLKKPEV